MNNETTYVIGHKNPDTDSIASSIAYSYLKNQLGDNTKPCRLSGINSETDYLLRRFGFSVPELMSDARCTLSEIELLEPFSIDKNATMFEALKLMEEKNHPFVAVVNGTKMEGFITQNDIAHIGLGDTALSIDLLKNTSVEDIAKTINGSIIYQDDHCHLNGKVSIIALSEHHAQNYEVKDRIVIVGDDLKAQIELIRKGAGLLIAVWTKELDPLVVEVAKQHHCSLIISGHGVMNTSRYLFFSSPVHLLMKSNLVTFSEHEFVEDVSKKMQKTRFRAYPVINEAEEFVGYIMKNQVINIQNKKLILVDHNEFSQSVQNVEKATILEVVDHHRINDFSSRQPISFRNEIVGSTATIVTSMFFENRVAIPKNLAGLLLGAIISDTLNFLSPTTSSKDIAMANELADISRLDRSDFADSIFANSLMFDANEMEELLYKDVKEFEIDGHHILVSQVTIPSMDVLDSYKEVLALKKGQNTNKKYDLNIIIFTSLQNRGSIFYVQGELAHLFENTDGWTEFMPGVYSRKKQVVPMIYEALR